MRTHALYALLPIALLAACTLDVETAVDAGDATPPSAETAAPAPDASEDVIASTNEPFWQARVEGDTVILSGIDAVERRLTGARASMTMDGRRIDAADAAGDVVLVVRRMRCEDDMSGARFPMTALLTIDGRGPFRGCARPASMPVPQPPGESAEDGAPALLPDRFVGRWGADASACAGEGGDMALHIEPGSLRFHESIATPTSVRRLDDDAVRSDLAFEGEGEVWHDTRILRLGTDGTLTVADEDGTAATRRVRCD